MAPHEFLTLELFALMKFVLEQVKPDAVLVLADLHEVGDGQGRRLGRLVARSSPDFGDEKSTGRLREDGRVLEFIGDHVRTHRPEYLETQKTRLNRLKSYPAKTSEEFE